MTTVLHIIQALSLGGAARALIATSRSSGRQGPYRHRVASLLRPAPEAVRLAEAAGVEVLSAPSPSSLHDAMAAADIVQLHWWNNPQNQALLRAAWPDTRLLIWYHIAGDHAPQVITPDLTQFADLNVPTNPWSYCELPVFRDLPAAEREQRVAWVIDAADLERVSGAQLRPHRHFNVGYIGAVDFVKMHRRFVPMSAAARIPDARFVVCGHGVEAQLQAEAAGLGAADRFEFRGYVEDIRSVIETLDVYGYPLCADSYASGELNLQEVMAVGVPPVVFPAGGIKGLVEHEKTGLVVHSEAEYTRALEHLFHHPSERQRLGQAAREHARVQFGADNAARQLNPLYERLLGSPKRPRAWGVPISRSCLTKSVRFLDVFDTPVSAAGARLFIESLGPDADEDFVTSLTSSNVPALFEAERRIAQCSLLMRSPGSGGYRQYLRNFPHDPFLSLWNALALDQEGQSADAVSEFNRVIERGCDHWRVRWYLAQAARSAGNEKVADEAARFVLIAAPAFQPARDFLRDAVADELPNPKSRAAGSPGQRGRVVLAPALFNHGADVSTVAMDDAAQDTPTQPAAPRNGRSRTDSSINEAFLTSQREFWNVESLDEAMYGRVFTSAEITRMPPAERLTAWNQSAVASMNQVLEGLSPQPGWRVLEIGCGVGRVIKPMRAQFAQVDGVDISERMIGYAREYLRDAPGRGEVLVNNGADLAGLPDASYDLVYSIIVFQHIRSVSVVRSYLRETRRVLKPGGCFRLQVYEASGRQGQFDEEAKAGVQYGFNGNGYTVSQLRQLLDETGFTGVQVDVAGRWLWASAQEPAFALARYGGEAPAALASAMTTGDSQSPLITAIVSTYKAEKFMRGCLEDLERQTIAERLEIIVIDSGSPENERAIVEEFQQRYQNIRYVRTEREPLYTAWNRGVRLARGQYVTNANTDDRHEPNALERHIAALEQNPDAVLAYADVAFCEDVHPDFGPARLRGHYRWPDFDAALLFDNCYIGPQPVWRREVHDRYGLFEDSYKSAGDYEFWLRLAVRERFVHVPEVLGLYWYSAKSVGHDNMDLTRAEADRARRSHWTGKWREWPKLKQRLLIRIDSNGDATRHSPPPARQRAQPAPPVKSPFVLEFEPMPESAPTTPRPVTATPSVCSQPDSQKGPTRAIGQLHRARIVSFVPSQGRVLVWGAGESIEELTRALPLNARLTWIELDAAVFERCAPGLRQRGVECLHRPFNSKQGPAEYVAATLTGLFDVIVVDGELRNHCLLRGLELLAPRGVVFLHDAQRPEFDLVKRAAVEYGHLGPCPDAPGAHLWWAGASLSPVPSRASSANGSPIVVNFYTANTPYEEEAKRLVASCRLLGVEVYSEAVPVQGEWTLNCAFKAGFILKVWQQLRRPVLWLDADAILRARPELLTGVACDFAVHKIDGWQFASGTVFFNQTPGAERLLRRWVERCTTEPTTWDQVSLDLAWEDVAGTSSLETFWLPDTYTKIFDRPSRFPARDIVAEHFQASRRLKKVVSVNQADERPKYARDLMAARRASRPLRDQLTTAARSISAPVLFSDAKANGSVDDGNPRRIERLARELVGMAERARSAGAPEKAVAFLWNATACAPAETVAWTRLQDLYQASGDIDAANHVQALARSSGTAPFGNQQSAIGNRPSSATTEDLLSTLRGRRIAIVGNATPADDFGSVIDGYDVVIRLNNFRLAGFENKIGRKTTYRCTSGWRDIEQRSEHLEFSPFAAHLPESANLSAYNAGRASVKLQPLLSPRADIHELLPAVPKPSTGCALVALCSHLGLTVDLFAFDGFKTSHYWAPGQPVHTTHQGGELAHLLRLPGVTLHSQLPMIISQRTSSPTSGAGVDNFGLPPGYQPRLKPEYYSDSITHATGIVWQPDVYPMVADWARKLGCFHVLDLGCGSGDKLAALHPEFMITGVDFGANIERCRTQYSFGQWLETDFERAEQLPLPGAVLGRTAVVCSDVIEHLVNPTALLRLVGRLLEQVPVVVLSTPDRERARGAGDLGPPKNKAHVREWTLTELEALLRSQQLPVEFIGFTRSNTQTGSFNTIIAVLTRNVSTNQFIPGARRGDPIGFEMGSVSGVPADRAPFGPADAAPVKSSPAVSPPAPSPQPTSAEVLDAAEARAREALLLNPNGVEALRLLVSIGLQRGKWQETGRICLQILHQIPVDLEALLALAKCFYKSGDHATTRTVLERVLEIDPNCGLARENLTAITAPAPATNGAGTSTDALAPCLQRAQQAIAAGDLPRARAALEQATALCAHDADIFVALGNVQTGCGDIGAARASYARALAIDPQHEVAGERLVELTVGADPSAYALSARSAGFQPAATCTDNAAGSFERAFPIPPACADEAASARRRPAADCKSALRLNTYSSAPPSPKPVTVVPATDATTAAKENAEMDYWRNRREQEGTLANGHYQAFYTTHFGLPFEFYSGRRVLDIGCGPRGSLEWAHHTAERVGLDPLADRYRDLGTTAHQMRYVASGSESIPFPDDSFDVVTSFNSLDHVADLDCTIAEILRVVKPGGLFLLLTDVNHSPTPCEPIEFGWEIVDRFRSQFDVVEERHFEKSPKAGLYRSVEEGLPYDHRNPAKRYGILSVKFRKRLVPVALANPAAAPLPAVAAPNSMGSGVDENQRAFAHLQHGFDRLKERRFAEAQTECARYCSLIRYDAIPREDRRAMNDPAPEVSVVIVAYRIGRGLIECLDSLAASAGATATPSYEIIIVDNGGNESIADALARRGLLHVRVPMNVILSEGRNIGVHFARAPIVAFVDDDALVEDGYIAAVHEAFATYDLAGYRGKVLPKTDHGNNRLARHYDMGGLPFPADVDTEGNSAFATAVYREMGGMDPLLFGMEGTELSYRIAGQCGEYRTIYWPRAVIRHDYAQTDDKLGQKNSRHQLMRDYAVFKHPKILLHHQNVIAFNQTDSSRATGHQLLRPARVKASPPVTIDGPFMTVCVPTYNRARFIEQTLESILRQTYPRFEIVVVDDGSTDETAEIVRRFAAPNLRFIRKEHSGGPDTRNRCIAEARGEFLVWVDSDDVILPKTLELYAAELLRYPDVDVLYGDLRVVNEQTIGDFISVYRDYAGWPGALIQDLVMENRIPNVCTLVRKSCYARFGGYDGAFTRAHDYEFWTRLAAGGVARRVNAVVGLYRQHSQSLSQHKGRTDTSYEARVVRQLVDRFGFARLFPHCFADGGADEPAGVARAAALVSLLLLKYGDVAGARQFVERSRKACALRVNARLERLLDGMFGTAGKPAARAAGGARASGKKPKSHAGAKSGKTGQSTFDSLVATGLDGFHAGQAGDCAAACSRLAEAYPEELETLILVGASLSRWGDPRAATTAFQCAFNRQSELAGLKAAETTAPAPAPTTTDLEPLVAALRPIFTEGEISAGAVQRTISFILELAAAPDSAAAAQRRSAGLTALFWAVVRFGDAELRRGAGDALADAVRRVAAALTSSSASTVAQVGSIPRTSRPSGYSFCIITNGHRPEKLRRQIESIRALALPQFEILIGGEIPVEFSTADSGVVAVPLAAAAREGRLGAMRNALARRARFDHLVVSDDDLIFAPEFATGLQRFGEDYDVMAVSLRNPDGSRFWDWATAGGVRGQVLLDYGESDLDVYVTGGLCVVKAEILDSVSWDASLGFYKGEDVDFSRRVTGAGLRLRFNPFCVVVHDDDRYTRVGRKVMRFDHLLNGATERYAIGDLATARQYLVAASHLAGTYADRISQVESIAHQNNDATWLTSLGKVSRRASTTTDNTPRTTDVPVRISWDGTFLDLGSLSHVNRELTSALARQHGVDVTCLRSSAECHLAPHGELASVASRLQSQAPQPAHVTVRHAWPPDWRRPRDGAWILIQPWEFGALPEEWVRELARVDEVWVPSQYVRRVYVESGVDPAKVQVVPNGVNAERFHRAAKPFALPTRKTFKFLFVGGTIHRKGPDVLLKAYLDRFTAADDVCLVIKDFGGQGVYAGQTFGQQIAAARARPNAPEILHLTDDLTAEQMAGLYAACNCLVHPYRGEGFGLPVLEAMACGRPVVVTAGGSTDDFVTDEHGWRIPSARRQFGDTVNGMKLARPGWFLEPDPVALGDQLEWIVAHPDEVRAKGRAAAEHARQNWTWDHAAAVAGERLRSVAARFAQRLNQPGAAQTPSIELPSCARVGHLADARALFESKDILAAWNTTVRALQRRPYHPEAWLLLAEIAQTAGDAKQARALAETARRMAPRWKPAQRFGKAGGKSAPRARVAPVELPPLPECLRAEAQKTPRLSVCLIVRNEEQFLDRCLESVRGLAEQIVVVDTGSTDGTVAIARKHGAEIHSFTWCDDFSAARNAALEHATGDWVFFLDADEELMASDHDKVRRLMQRPSVIAYRLPIVDQGREEEGVNYVPRLYRNAPGLFYVGRVHEQVFSSVEVRRGEWGLENEFGDATLLHHGYTKEVVTGREKNARNLRLLEQAIAELPGEPNLLMNLGLELVRAGRLHEGLERYQHAFEAMAAQPKEQVSPELREALLTQYATHLLTGKHYAEIARLYQSPLARQHGLTATMHWLLGLACIESKLYSEGAEQMQQCLQKRGKRTLTLANRKILKGGPHHCLALCLGAMKREAEASRAFQAALQEEPETRIVRFDYARFLAGTGQEVEALKWVHQLMAEDPSDVRVWRLGGAAALQKPEFIEFALDWTGEAVKHHPQNAPLAEQRAAALLLGGRPEEALPLLRSLVASPGFASTAASAILICQLALGQAPANLPVDLRGQADADVLRWYRRLLQWNTVTVVAGLNQHIERLKQQAPAAAGTIEAALAEAAL